MRKNDYLLLVFLVFLTSVGYFLHSSVTASQDKILIVQHDQNVLQKIDLKKLQAPKEIKISTEHGTVMVHADNNDAYVVDSPCPDKLCVYQGKITHAGQTIVCLPEKVLLTLTTTGNEGALDAIIR